MRALAVFTILAIFLWTCIHAPMLAIVLFVIFILPGLITALAFASPQAALLLLLIVAGIGIVYLPWVTIPLLVVLVIIAGVASSS